MKLLKTQGDILDTKPRKRTVSIKRYKVLRDGTKVEVPASPLNITTSGGDFSVKIMERKVSMTP